MTGRAGPRQERCVPMAAGSAEIASEQRTPRRSLGEQRHYGAAGIARRLEPGLSFAQGAQIGGAYGKCRMNILRTSPDTLTSPDGTPSYLPVRNLPDACVLGGLCLIALALRLPSLGHRPLWMDEAYTWWYASRGLSYLWGTVPSFESHPPLYYTIIHGVLQFGDSELLLRLPSLLFALALLPVIFLIARELMPGRGWPASLCAGLPVATIALSGFQIAFAQEARPYTALCLGVAVVLWGALRVLRRWDAIAPCRPWVAPATPEAMALGIGGGITLWLHNLAPIYVASVMLPVVCWSLVNRKRWRFLPVLSGAAAVALAIYAPYLPRLVDRTANWSTSTWMAPLTLYRARNIVEEVFALHALTANEYARLVLFVAILAVLCVGLWQCWRRVGRWEALLLGTAAALPILVLVALSLTMAPVFATRLLLPVTIPCALLIGLAACRLRIGSLRWPVAGIICAFFMMTSIRGYASQQNEPWDEIARLLKDQVKPGDVLAVYPNDVELPLMYYHSLTLPSPIIALPAAFPAVGLNNPYPYGTPAVPGLTRDDIDHLLTNTASAQRLWVVVRTNPASNDRALLERTLATYRTLNEHREMSANGIAILRWDKSLPKTVSVQD